jgi:hypothetical protein
MSIEKPTFRFTSEEAEDTHRDRFVFTFFRDLDVSERRVYHRTLRRGTLYRISTYPERVPDYGELLDTGVNKYKERIIPAKLQAENLFAAYSGEGLVVLDLTESQAVELDIALNKWNFPELNIEQALTAVTNLPNFAKEKIRESIHKTAEYAKNVLDTTRQEIAKARAGKMGKAFLDSRDKQACFLLNIPESNITSAEAEARNTTLQQLATTIIPNNTIEALTKEIESLKQSLNELKEENEVLKNKPKIGRPKKQKVESVTV